MIEAQRVKVTGVVQGVGFRPFIYRLAHTYQLTGWVLNAIDGVTIHCEGSAEHLDAFVLAIANESPPAALVQHITIEPCELQHFTSFEIRHSDKEDARETTLVSPDLATCDDCTRELFDPMNRRYRYPFINCTNCGPRYTIIEKLPYDRPNTSMKVFPLCDACKYEYENPLDRRFHAQPNACFECGPHISWYEVPRATSASSSADESTTSASVSWSWGTTREESDAILARAVQLLAAGGIVAIKGLGGFHLAVDASNARALATLRARKHRKGKAFAVMMPSLESVQRVCDVSVEEAKVLLSPARPIVLLKKKPHVQFAQGLADALPELGVMLPQTPLHHLLLHDFCAVSGRDMLVMTSGNVHNNPLVITDEEALRELGGIADAFVSNNRDIRVRIDDSVVRVLSFTHVKPSECAPTVTASAASTGSAASIADEGEEAASLPNAEEETASRASTAPVSEPATANATAPASVSAKPEPAIANATAPAPVPEPEPAQSAYSPAQTTTAVQFIRRARGYAPLPLSLKHEHHANETLLALGAEQKNTITLVSGTRAFVSQHIGDVENAATYDSWLAASSRYEQLFFMHPTAFACDKHPEYLPSKWARDEHRASQLPLVEVQHHHAHIASVLGEHNITHAVCGIAYDGTGYGTDGRIWGGEILVATQQAFERFANFAYVPLPGGAKAIREPLRCAYGVLWAFDLLEHPAAKRIVQAMGAQSRICAEMIEKDINCPYTSSVGRLFDAAAAITGVCCHPSYEGEPAILFDAARGTLEPDFDKRYRMEVVKNTASAQATAQDTSVVVIDAAPAFRALLDDMEAGVELSVIATRFHTALLEVSVLIARMVANVYQLSTVALSGGVFMNRFLVEYLVEYLNNAGLTVALNANLPPNDGCISFGQAVVALRKQKW